MLGITQQNKEGDPRVAAALNRLGIKFRIDPDGDFQFGFNLEHGRSQMGFIRSSTYQFGGVELREVFSAGLRSFGPFDARTTNFLLEQNSKMKVGAWSVVRDAQDNHVAIFRASVAADISSELLLGVILVVLTTADGIEARLSGRDDF
ncbi:MAG TPA: hypothetical protein PKX23_19380 [Verrucomicrobiota bacterium]|jgi:hypothetical protein|nr:hypothetical protein [Verrucomicrobiota bacterium]